MVEPKATFDVDPVANIYVPTAPADAPAVADKTADVVTPPNAVTACATRSGVITLVLSVPASASA